ncbi:MAG: hypothetical protein RLZZ303_2278 [Candidatus Hydrogenedentota bacterium]
MLAGPLAVWRAKSPRRSLSGKRATKEDVAREWNTLKEAAGTDRSRRFWQSASHQMAIYSETFWRQKIDYLPANPFRKGLVLYPEEWRFSSARYYMTFNDADTEVPITQLDWHCRVGAVATQNEARGGLSVTPVAGSETPAQRDWRLEEIPCDSTGVEKVHRHQ